MKRAAGFLVALAVLFAVVAVLKSGPPPPSGGTASTAMSAADRDRVLRFWEAYRRATALRIAGDTREAAAEYIRALTLDPEHHDALYYLGNMEFELGDVPAAKRAWQRLIALEPTSARAHSQLGTLYFCVGGDDALQPDSAAAEFRRAAAINPEETGPLLSLGEIALVRGDAERALDYFDAVLGSNYSSVAAHFYKGYLAWESGAPEQASELLTAARLHAAPAAPKPDASNEGDTRTGTRPMTRAPHRCESMRARAVALAARGVDGSGQAAPVVYRDFDDLLRSVRTKLP